MSDSLRRPHRLELTSSSLCGISQARILEWVGCFLLYVLYCSDGPSVTTRVPRRVRQEGQCQRRCDDVSRGQSEARP